MTQNTQPSNARSLAHPQEIKLVNPDGTLTDEGLRLSLNPLTKAQREALNAQALNQEVYGASAQAHR